MENIFAPRFQNETAAREHLEALQWPRGPVCPHCKSSKATRLPAQRGRPSKAHPEGAIREGVIQCNTCRKQYSVTVGTVFESSKVPLHKWLLCTHLLCASKKGMSAHQIGRMVGVSYKTAWFMMHRIREAMKQSHWMPMGGEGTVVEADETYVGGKLANKHANKRPAKLERRDQRAGPRLETKQAVVALVERGGDVRSFHVAKVTGATLRHVLVTNVDRSTALMTDEHSGYKMVGTEFASHGIVVHSRGEYVRADVHSNTVENFFSLLKRGIVGVYHHVSEQHLRRYCAEFDFRYNTRKDTDAERSDAALKGIRGKRLTYRRSVAVAA